MTSSRVPSPGASSGPRLFEIAFENAPAPLAVLGGDGRLLRLNRSFRDLTGYAAGELDGKGIETLAHGEGASVQTLVERLCANALASDNRAEACWRRQDGSTLWVSLSCEVIQEEGFAPCVVLHAEGLNGRYGEEEGHRLLANNVSDIVSVYGPDGACEYISPSVERVLGYAPAEMIGRQATYLVPAKGHGHGRTAAAKAGGQAQGSSATHLVPMRRKDGVEVCVEISTRRTTGPDGRSLIVAVTRDVTDRVERDHRFHLIA
ncbi:PAS domain-containing protein, partial [uncultured Phenylobacterium sp.]|uniref:PAS domain-containing protein n=1 Tax=uncultured Phenylobacterium sp. TaxID=349273 RepID=UPI0025F4E57F